MQMDLGGELGRSRAVCDCFEKAGYKIELTVANSV